MTPHQIVAVCLRFLALIWLLHVLSQSYGLFTYLRVDAGAASKTVVWLFAFAQLLGCAVLWFFSRTIASKLLPFESKQPSPPDPPRLVEWQTLGVICIGLWAASTAVPDAIFWVTFFNMSFSAGSGFGELDAERKASFFSTVAEILISAWLLLGAKGFAALLFKVRTAGVSK